MSGHFLLWKGGAPDTSIDRSGFDNPANWDLLGTTKPYTAPPGPNDTIMFGAGQAEIGVYNPDFGEGAVATAVLAPGAQVTFGGAQPEGDLTIGNLYLDDNASMSYNSGALFANNVILEPGSNLDLAGVPFNGAHMIGDLWGVGGNLISTGTLLIGGPGFVQEGVSTPDELNVHAGNAGWIDLGNVAQGSYVAPVFEDLLDANFLNIFGASFKTWTDGGFTMQGFGQQGMSGAVGTGGTPTQSAWPPSPVGQINVSTAQLGSHVAILTDNLGHSLAIVDNVVKAPA